MTAPRCTCGLEMFWEILMRRFLCPARFDGKHPGHKISPKISNNIIAGGAAVSSDKTVWHPATILAWERIGFKP